jgi:hypothetical protein
MTKDTAPVQARKLNMEEKRKLEKLLLQDIETAESAYSKHRAEQRRNLEAEILRNPERVVQTALRNAKRAVELKRLAERQLVALGYDLDYQNRLCISRQDRPKPLKDFDRDTAANQKRLADARRSYTMKLFAGGEEAQQLFASLARELANIIS